MRMGYRLEFSCSFFRWYLINENSKVEDRSFTPGFPKDSSGDGRMTVTLDSKVAYLLGAGSYSQDIIPQTIELISPNLLSFYWVVVPKSWDSSDKPRVTKSFSQYGLSLRIQLQ